MSGIFVSYRRQDSAGHARALYDRLRERFRQRVFMDVEGIEPGVDFVEVIENAVGECEVMLALIGREWSDIADEKGARRLNDPHDFIRLEVSTALSRNVTVVPVLLEGASMPSARELPDDLAKLARRQAIELRDNRWDADVDALIQRLEKVLSESQGKAAGQSTGRGTATSTASDSTDPSSAARATQSGPSSTGSNAAPRAATTTTASKLRPLHLAIAGIALAIVGAVGYMVQGGGKVVVPKVVGISLEAATERLRAEGLVVGETARQRSREYPPNTVIDQAPNAGLRLAKGEAVKLRIAERAPLVVPNLVDKPLETAKAELAAAGFTVGTVTQEAHERAKPGTILRTQPQAGSEIATQSTNVDIVVAIAPERKPVATLRAPNVVGKSIAEARALIAAAGFTVGRVATEATDRAAAESVLAQNPPAGTEIASERSQIDLRIAIAKPAAKPAAPPSPPVAAEPPSAPPAVEQLAKGQPAKPAPDAAAAQRVLRLMYSGEQSRAQAATLAAYFRQLGWTIESIVAGPSSGNRVVYNTDAERALADSVANRASWWLGQQGHPNLAFPPVRAGAPQPNTPMTLWLAEPAARAATESTPKSGGARASGDAAIRVGAGLSVAEGGEAAGRNADVTLDQRVDPTQTQWFLTPQNRARVAQVRGATREDCAQGSYYDIPIPTRQLRIGSIICVRNANGAFAALQVKRVPNYGYYQLDVSYTIW